MVAGHTNTAQGPPRPQKDELLWTQGGTNSKILGKAARRCSAVETRSMRRPARSIFRMRARRSSRTLFVRLCTVLDALENTLSHGTVAHESIQNLGWGFGGYRAL